MDIVYVAHCVPWPPDKGERIRAFHSVKCLAEHFRVHLACIARNDNEAQASNELSARLASVHIEVLDLPRALVRGFIRAALGGSFTAAFYHVPALHAYVRSIIANHPIGAVVLLSSAMALYAPEATPFIADWGDVDSEKRLQYARMRFPGLPHRLEAYRLRNIEREYAKRSRRTFLTTQNEMRLFQGIAPDAALGVAGNGVDTDWFDPAQPLPVATALRDRKYIVFVGVLSYFPNSDGVCWFTHNIFPELRKRDPTLELFLVGRNPGREVLELAKQDGVTVTGGVDDVRPYLAAARAVVVPLRIARGIQNKVLEALAMGKPVWASEEVCRTFMPDVPTGVVRCNSLSDYVDAAGALPGTAAADTTIAAATRARFSWASNLAPLVAELDAIAREGVAMAAS